jgi:hypothetical protein
MRAELPIEVDSAAPLTTSIRRTLECCTADTIFTLVTTIHRRYQLCLLTFDVHRTVGHFTNCSHQATGGPPPHTRVNVPVIGSDVPSKGLKPVMTVLFGCWPF